MKQIDPRKNPLNCRYVTIEMNYPRTASDAETFLWYLYHEKAQVFISRKGEWFLLVPSQCSQLTPTGRCRISGWQLRQCGQYSAPDETRIESIARFLFKGERDLLSYLKKTRPALFRKLPADTRRVVEGPGGK